MKRPKIISPYKPYVKAREIHKITPPININIENKNFNTNNQTINLLDKVLRGKLTGEQLDEIKEIIDKNKDEKTAKREVVKKLESFGINTLSNIVSALITNPAIMSSLFG